MLYTACWCSGIVTCSSCVASPRTLGGGSGSPELLGGRPACSAGAAAGGSPGDIAGDMMPVVLLPVVGSGLLPCSSVPAVAVGCCSTGISFSPGGARRSVRRMKVVVPVHEKGCSWRHQGVASHFGAPCGSSVVGLV